MANSSGRGIGIMGFLALLFITLKLLGVSEVASWSWWLVTIPLWGPAMVLIVVLLVAFSISISKK